MVKVEGVVVTKIGDYQDVLSVSKDIQSDYPSISLKLTPGSARIAVEAAGLCFPDVLTVEGKHIFKKTAPFIPANEVAGTILEINHTKDTKHIGLKVGDRVFGVATTGSLASEAICEIENLYHCPSTVNLDTVAGFEVNYGTTYHGLVDIAKAKKDEVLLVLGASGGVGMAAIDLGKALGCKVIAVASSEEKLKYCQEAGADILLNYNEDTNGGKTLKDLLKESKVYGKIDIIYDPVGGKFTEQAFRALGWGGRLLVIGFAAGGTTPKKAIPRLPLNLALLNERVVQGVLYGAWKILDKNRINRENMKIMMNMITDGKLKPLVSKEYSFNKIKDAFDDMMSRKVIGKVIVRPSSIKANL